MKFVKSELGIMLLAFVVIFACSPFYNDGDAWAKYPMILAIGYLLYIFVRMTINWIRSKYGKE